MYMDFDQGALDHRKLSEELHQTPWWNTLMHQKGFQDALQRNTHMRLRLGDASYLKKLLRSEAQRQAFLHQVYHPTPDHLAFLDETD